MHSIFFALVSVLTMTCHTMKREKNSGEDGVYNSSDDSSNWGTGSLYEGEDKEETSEDPEI